MKLLTRLRNRDLHDSYAPMTDIRWAGSQWQNRRAMDDQDAEFIGIGASSVEDLEGIQFSSDRRRIPEIHEEMPPRSFAVMDILAETED